MDKALLEKIRRLRALSQSSNVHEAAAAAAKVNQLIQEHRLSEAELEDPEDHEKASVDVEPLDVWGQNKPAWKRILIVFLRKNNGCEGYNDRRMINGKVCWVSIIVGRPGDVQTVRYLYAYLVSEITRIAVLEGKGNGKVWFRSFYLGAVAGVTEAMKKADTAVRATASSTALIRLDQRMEDAKSAITVTLKTKSIGGSNLVNSDAFERGREVGRSLHGGAKLGHGGTKLLGG